MDIRRFFGSSADASKRPQPKRATATAAATTATTQSTTKSKDPTKSATTTTKSNRNSAGGGRASKRRTSNGNNNDADGARSDRVDISASEFFERDQTKLDQKEPPAAATKTIKNETMTSSPRRQRQDSNTQSSQSKRPKRDSETVNEARSISSTKTRSQRNNDKYGDDDDPQGDEDFEPVDVDGDDDDDKDDSDTVLVMEPPPTKHHQQQQQQSSPRLTSPRRRAPPSSTSSPSSTKAVRAPPAPKPSVTNSSRPQQKNAKKQPPRRAPLQPIRTLEDFDWNQPQTVSQPLSGYTFVLTGVVSDNDVSRDDVSDWIKNLGGRVTTAVSSKTDYLVVLGSELEDGRPSTEGSKYKKAAMQASVQLVHGKAGLLGLMQQYCDLVAENTTVNSRPNAAAAAPNMDKTKQHESASVSSSTAATSVKRPNPYAKKSTSNPYDTIKKSKLSHNQDIQQGTASSSQRKVDAAGSSTPLWVDRYKPQSTQEILGNQDSVRKLKEWLARWEERFNKDSLVGRAFSNPQGPWKAALLSGPPGIGSRFFVPTCPSFCPMVLLY